MSTHNELMMEDLERCLGIPAANPTPRMTNRRALEIAVADYVPADLQDRAELSASGIERVGEDDRHFRLFFHVPEVAGKRLAVWFKRRQGAWVLSGDAPWEVVTGSEFDGNVRKFASTVGALLHMGRQ